MAAPPGVPAAWDSTPRRRLVPGVLLVVALLGLVPAAVSTLLRLLPPSDDAGALLASFIPYGLLGYAVGLVCLLLELVRSRHKRVLAAVVLLVLALAGGHVYWLAPFFVADHRPRVGPSFTLLTLNVYKGEAEVRQVDTAAQGADIVVLAETTPEFLARLDTPAWQQRFPHAVPSRRQGTSDTTVYSRYPLGAAQALGPTSFQQWVMTVRVPGRSPVRLIAAHPCNPFCGRDQFASDHALLRASVEANTVYPLVLAGDLNAVDDHAPLQQLRRGGMRSATDLVGAGWLPTYPANRTLPPLLPIDHVMVNDQMHATSLRTVPVHGTDHLGLLVTLVGSR